MRFEVDPHGLVGADAQLRDFAERLADPRPGLERMADDLFELNRRAFADGQGGGWPELSPRYAAEKARTGEQTMRDADELFDSLTKRGADTLQIDRDGLWMGLRGPQHKGRAIAAHKRPVIRVTATDRGRLIDRLRSWLRTGGL